MRWPLLGRDEVLDRFAQRVAGEPGASLLLVGDAGVGKSRLLREFLELAGQAGLATQLVEASRTAAEIPFGAFAHLIPPEPASATANELQLIVSIRHTLHQRAGRNRLVVGIDDVPNLDRGSAMLVEHLARADDTVTFVLTARDNEPLPEAIRELRERGHLDGMTIQPLTRATVEQLVAARLEGHVSQPIHHELWRLSQGNPLLLRELVEGGLEQQALQRIEGIWQLTMPLPSAERVADVVSYRLATLGTDQSWLASILAVGEQLGADPLDAQLDSREELEERHLLRVEKDGRRLTVHLAHPLHGEVLRATMPKTRLRRLAGELADRALASGARRRDDPLRVATWLQQAGRPIPVELASRAATQALLRSDAPFAEELARAAVSSGGEFRAHLILGRALVHQGRSSDADAALQVAQQRATTDTHVAQCATARMHNAAFVAGDPHRALRIGEQALDTLDTPAAITALKTELAFTSALMGNFRQVVDLSSQVLDRTDLDDRTLLRCMQARQTALVWLGQLVEADELYLRAQGLAETLLAEQPLASHWITGMHAEQLAYAGRLHEAESVARTHYRNVIQRNVQPVLGAAAAEVVIPLMLAGRLAEALASSHEALANLQEGDPVGIHPLAASTAAAIACQVADHRLAQELLDQIEPTRRQLETRTHVFSAWAQAWVQAADGDLEAAAATAAEAGRRAADADYMVWGAIMLHDAARLGHPRLVKRDLTKVAAYIDGKLIPTMAQHTEALADKDPDELDAVSRRFAHMDAGLFASEAATRAAHMHQQSQHHLQAQRSATQAALLRRDHPEAATPSLTKYPIKSPLTDRELDVCAYALSGRTSRVIAEQLVLSVRTVEAHMASTYRKLDIHNRSDLAARLTARVSSSPDSSRGPALIGAGSNARTP